MTIATDVVRAAAACVAVGALVRVAQFASSKDVEKATVRQHARAIATHAGIAAASVAALAAVYWAVTTLFYRGPDVPELIDAPAAGPARVVVTELPEVAALRSLMQANVTPRAPPPMRPVVTPNFR